MGVFGLSLGFTLASTSAVALLSLLFSLGDSLSDALVFGAVVVACGGAGFALLRRPFSTERVRPVPTLTAAVCCYLVVAGISAAVYVLTGSLDRLDDALYESVAGVSTNALTIFDDPSVNTDAVLIWRSATQWLGGLGALTMAVGLLPFLGGSRELTGGPQRRLNTNDALAPRPPQAIKRVAVIYGVVTAGVIAALLGVGMSVRDAAAHALSTVSTGGFSTRAESIAAFDSPAIEFVLIIAMLGAGSSAAFAWMVWRGKIAETREAFELQTYLIVMAGATLWIWWLHSRNDFGAPVGAGRALRESFFTVVSIMTTTGHRISPWGDWHPGASALLLVLLVVGGTAGSVAGGLRWIRVIGMAQFIWRELQRQLHPRSVRTVKVGRTRISEASVDRMHAQMVYIMTLGAVASLVLALFGEGITEAITLTISAISTTGPGFDDQGAIVSAAALSRPERAVLMPVMLTGRLFLYPAFVVVAATAIRVARAARTLRPTADPKARR